MTGKTTGDWMPMFIDAMLILFLLVGIVAVLLGLILLLSQKGFERLNSVLARRYSGRRAMKPLEVPHYYEAFFYRHNRWTGGVILAGALFFMLSVGLRYSPATAAAALPGIDWIWEGVFWALVLGNALALVIGVIILLRPSLLKPLEASANRWVSMRQAMRPLDQSHDGADRLVRQYPRASGLALLVAGLFLVATFGVLLAS